MGLGELRSEMGRRKKVVKKARFQRALLRWGGDAAMAARSLGLSRSRFYHWTKRLGIIVADYKEPAPKLLPASPKALLASPPAAVPAKPEHNILRLTASDFTGPYRGEVGGPGSKPRSADELLDRYHRLRDK